jgi:protein-glutamine gamma-glutamyltransferase
MIMSGDPVPVTLAHRDTFWFRLFNHGTLALAGICLIHGEAYFLPLLPWCLLPYLALLVAAFRAEGRWVLSDRLANVAGVFIVVGMALWIRYQPGGPGILKGQEYWVRLVPYVGPFLMALMTVQLFQRHGDRPRPEGGGGSPGAAPGPKRGFVKRMFFRLFRSRAEREFWTLQGMGLIQVALGCVLASSPLFGLLMTVYLTSALGCLALHYLAAPGITGKPPSWQWLLGFVARFSLAVAAVGLAVFLITPRSQASYWDPLQRFGNRAAPPPTRWAPPNGFNMGANLNGTNIVELPRDEAFTFRATDARGPKLDLSLETRFRTLVLESYLDGVWPLDSLGSGYRSMSKAMPFQKDLLPDFGPDQYFIHFDVRPRPGIGLGLVLAEPIQIGPYGMGRHIPAVLTDFSRPHAQLFYLHPHSGTLLPVPGPSLDWARYRYKQVIPKTKDPDRVPAEIPAGQSYIAELTKQSLPRLEMWTTALLRRLAHEPRYDLPLAVLVPDPSSPNHTFLVDEAQRERVARALCKYLNSSGDFTYSLEQRRRDLTIDPVEDFLINIKEGHCERYASALVLMLRTQGVPARLIKGFRGAESTNGGSYIVRQNMAHAWVEVLVRRRPGTKGGPYEWLTLDPTPGIDAPRAQSVVADWWKEKTGAGADMWKNLIVGYNAESKGNFLQSFTPRSALSGVEAKDLYYTFAFAAALFVAFCIGVFRFRRRPRVAAAPTTGVACYTRLIRLLDRRAALRRAPWQTPRELAASAGAVLQARAATAALADLPDRIVDLFYRVRYGGESPGSAELSGLNARLDELALALNRPGPIGSRGTR